jgi:hypothetical protein
MQSGLESGIFFAGLIFFKKNNMKKFFLAGIVFLSMTGFTMAQGYHPHHHHHHGHHHHPGHR